MARKPPSPPAAPAKKPAAPPRAEKPARPPKPQPQAWLGRGEKRKIRRSAINWSAPDARLQWLENVKARREELKKGGA